MKKDGIQTRKRKPKNVKTASGSSNTTSSSDTGNIKSEHTGKSWLCMDGNGGEVVIDECDNDNDDDDDVGFDDNVDFDYSLIINICPSVASLRDDIPAFIYIRNVCNASCQNMS